jgi:hypothetical protein
VKKKSILSAFTAPPLREKIIPIGGLDAGPTGNIARTQPEEAIG